MLHRQHPRARRSVISARRREYCQRQPSSHCLASPECSRAGASSTYIPAWPTVLFKRGWAPQAAAWLNVGQSPKRRGASSTLVHARATVSCKHGPALEAPARANVGQFVGAAARGGSEFIACQKCMLWERSVACESWFHCVQAAAHALPPQCGPTLRST
jgi:hypothetical protein